MPLPLSIGPWARRHHASVSTASDAATHHAASGTPDLDGRDIIELEHVTKRLDGRTAIADVSLAVQRGTLYALIGPSGSGKTTTVRMICGIYAPDAGTVRLFGHSHLPWPRALKQRLGYMPQTESLYPRLTATENLRYAAALQGVSRDAATRRLAEVLQLVELTDQRQQLAGSMSGGQRRRLALFVDEPTAGLDPALRIRLWAYFRALAQQGRTVVVTTQYIDEAELTDRVAILRAAQLVAVGTPAELAHRAFGGEIVVLRSPDMTTQAAKALAEMPGVHDVRFVDLETLEVVVEAAEAAAPYLLAALSRWGCTVRSIALRRPRFEEVFLQLTGVAPSAASSAADLAPEVPDA
jgi:ABC-2 type transport system ATP-binding protein